MDMIEFQRASPQAARAGDGSARTARPSVLERLAADELAGELGREIAVPLTAALERVNALAATGRIDRSDLAALRLEIENARRAGMLAQQLARVSGGNVRQVAEQLNLTQLVGNALSQRAREMLGRNIVVRQMLRPAHIVGDAALTFSLVHALLEWAMLHARGRIDIRLDVLPWPVQAQLVCRLAHASPDTDSLPPMDTIAWHMVEATSHAMGLEMRRDDTAEETRITIEFPRTVNELMEGASAIELDEPLSTAPHSLPLAGSHVLVMAARREMRSLVRDAIRPMGLMIDYTTTVEETREFCRGGLPHAIVYESALAGDRFAELRKDLLAEAPTLGFIAIGEVGDHAETVLPDEHPVTWVGREAVLSTLPSALLFELSRGIPA
jgi:hypothetical protein